MSIQPTHNAHADPDIAHHFDWGFRSEALLWLGQHPMGINFHPFATEFHQWLQQKGQFPLFTEEDKKAAFSITNPFTYHASAIAAVLAQVINSVHAFATSIEPHDSTQAEIERIRLYNEQILYTARFCEATIKQLLYCTQIPESHYKRSALGALLSMDCRACKGAGGQRHNISLLGSLAHRYHLCLPFEHCLFDHLKIVSRRRNTEAAHSESQSLQVRSVSASRALLMQDSLETGTELVHMLEHISDLEKRMHAELSSEIINDGTSA